MATSSEKIRVIEQWSTARDWRDQGGSNGMLSSPIRGTINTSLVVPQGEASSCFGLNYELQTKVSGSKPSGLWSDPIHERLVGFPRHLPASSANSRPRNNSPCKMRHSEFPWLVHRPFSGSCKFSTVSLYLSIL